VTARLQRSAEGVPLSLRSWSSHLFQGRPGHRLQPGSGRRPSDRSMRHHKAWWAGVSSGRLATCPNSELRRRTIGSNTDQDLSERKRLCSARGRHSRRFRRQSPFSATVWTGLYTSCAIKISNTICLLERIF